MEQLYKEHEEKAREQKIKLVNKGIGGKIQTVNKKEMYFKKVKREEKIGKRNN